MKKIVFRTALLVLSLAGLAFAQSPAPTATIHQMGLSATQAGASQAGPVAGSCPNNDCIFYGGDSDPSSPNADGLWQNNSSFSNIDGRVYSPFIVPAKTGKCGGACKWAVDGLFANIEYFPNEGLDGTPIMIDSVNWAIVQGVAEGGTPSSLITVCSGNDTSFVLTPTGRIFFTYFEEDATSVHVAGCTLSGGKGKTGAEFWMIVQPQTSVYQLAYESNSPTNANAIGIAEPQNDSWFWGPTFGATTFVNANTLGPLATFSTGVCATLVKK